MTDVIVYLNGVYLPKDDAAVSIDDRGFLFADSLYDVARAIHSPSGPVLFCEDLHWARISNGMAALGIDGADGDACGVGGLAPSRPTTASAIIAALPHVSRELIARNGLCTSPGSTAIVYVHVTRGVAPRGHAMPTGLPPTLLVYAKPYVCSRRSDASATLAPDSRWGRCGIKTTGLLGNCVANTGAVRSGAYEALLLRPRWGATPVRPRAPPARRGAPLAQFGEGGGPAFAPADLLVVEASHSNVFAVMREGDDAFVLLTHPLDNVLPGISRAVILTRFAPSPFFTSAEAELGGALTIREGEWTLQDLLSGGVSELIVTSSGVDVQGITRVECAGCEGWAGGECGSVVVGGGAPGPVTRALIAAFEAWVAEAVGGA